MEHLVAYNMALRQQVGREPIMTYRIGPEGHTSSMGNAQADVRALAHNLLQQQLTDSPAIEGGSSSSQPGLAVHPKAPGTLGCVTTL